MFDAGHAASEGWVLKGGYALELRFHRARSTKDLDFTVRLDRSGPSEREGYLRERLQQAAEISLPDFFTFIVGEESLALDQAPAGGSRFPVDARLDGRTFVKFHVDLGLGDEVLEPTERLSGEDWLGFAGIPPVNIPALSAEQHWAEKLHAYTLPRGGATNSRAKDLVDLVMLIEWHALRPGPLREAVRATFNRRRTHAVPTAIPAPPSTWTKSFAALATECGLHESSANAHAKVDAFWRSLASEGAT